MTENKCGFVGCRNKVGSIRVEYGDEKGKHVIHYCEKHGNIIASSWLDDLAVNVP